jgi:hypothetical protein
MLYRFFSCWIRSSFFLPTLILFSLLLFSPSLGGGWFADDMTHRLVFLGHPDLAPPSGRPMMELFSFVSSEEQLREYIHRGYAPWWTAPKGLHLAFWRPLAGVSHALDYLVWPNSAWLMHLHNLLCFGFLIGLLGLLYRQFLGSMGIGWGIAVFSYATYWGASMPVTWIANRNAILAAMGGVCTMLLHHRWRQEKGWRWMAGALFALLASLLSAEAGIATCAYLFAYACFLDTSTSWRERLLSLLPYGMLVLSWRVVYRLLGYGIQGIELYADPLLSPLAYLGSIVERLPLLVTAFWWLLPPTPYILLHDNEKRIFWWLTLVGFLLILWLLWPLRRDKLSRFWATGMFFSLLPVCAVFPDDRNLLFVSIGGCGLFARLVALRWPLDAPPHLHNALSPARHLAIALLLFFHLLISPLAAPLRILGMLNVAQTSHAAAKSLDITNQNKHHTFVLLNSPASLLDLNIPLYRAFLYPPTIQGLRVLAPSFGALHVERLDSYTLRLRPEGGFIRGLDEAFRSTRKMPFKAGQTIQLPVMLVKIESVLPDGRPDVATFRFPRKLEHRRMHFYQAGWYGHRPFSPPAIGQSITLPPMRSPRSKPQATTQPKR